MQKKIAIKIEDLTVSYADKPALWDIDLDIIKIMQGSFFSNYRLSPIFNPRI